MPAWQNRFQLDAELEGLLAMRAQQSRPMAAMAVPGAPTVRQPRSSAGRSRLVLRRRRDRHFHLPDLPPRRAMHDVQLLRAHDGQGADMVGRMDPVLADLCRDGDEMITGSGLVGTGMRT